MIFEVVAIVAVSLLAILVGAAIPVLVQLARTLRRTREFIDTTGGRLERTLDAVDAAARRLNGVGAGLEEAGERLRAFLDAAGNLGEALSDLSVPVRSVSRTVKALGPAFLAGLRSMFAPGAAPHRENENRYTENTASERSTGLKTIGGNDRDIPRKEAQHGE